MSVKQTFFSDREKCYSCYRPKSSCMCDEITPFETNTKFVILMHPKEFKKTKNTTGRFTHLSLKNSELFIDDNFTNHKRVNDIISSYDSYVLYPSNRAINISDTKPNINKKMAIFIIDSTWSCAKNILRDSTNLQHLQYISFKSTKISQYKIKEQPKEHCLSTIESTLCILELLNKYNIEEIDKNNLESFLNPFHKMVDYQLKCISENQKLGVRFKIR